MKVGLVVVLVGMGGVSRADPSADSRWQAGGFMGVDYFGDNIQLGNSWAAEQIPETSVVLGARLAYWLTPASRVQLGVEGELSLTPSSTGDADTRMAYFAPVFGWHAHAIARFGHARLRPHLLVGAGGETIASTSPFMTKETDPVAYWGAGASAAIAGTWQLRLDVRHGVMPAREGSATSTLEFELGFATTFGLPTKLVRHATPPPIPEQPRIDATDTDGDGIPDPLDNCPRAAETVNGTEDEDGCPEEDPDHDGFIGALDKCPDEAEDVDGFEDTDGCADLDNDRDGIPDERDRCPDAAETRNGIDDDDGCADTMPADVTKALAAASVTFEPARSRITDGARRSLAALVTVMTAHADLQIAITGHPDKAGDAPAELARRRAEAVKWYLVDQGFLESRVTTRVGLVGKPPIDVALVVSASNH